MALKFLKRKPADPVADLRSVLGTEVYVPTFPSTVIKALEALRSQDSSAADVAAVIGNDPGLTVRLLKLVNSAALSPAKPVNSVDQAVAVAGFGTVESLVLSVGVNSALPKSPVDGFDQTRFWKAASRRAAVARAFANELHPVSASLCFTAGLLQDMAVPVLALARPDYRPLLQQWHEGGEDLHTLEASAFPWTHSSVAELLCAQWDLPDALASAIGGHHDGGSSAPPGVLLAAPFREVEVPEARDAVIATATEQYGLDPDHVVILLERADIEAVEIAGLLS